MQLESEESDSDYEEREEDIMLKDEDTIEVVYDEDVSRDGCLEMLEGKCTDKSDPNQCDDESKKASD